MSNTIFRALNEDNILRQFNEFRRTFYGNPKEEVQKLLDSGRMTQEDFNRFSQMANQLHSFLGGR